MKAIFVSYNQAWNEEIILALEKYSVRGFTRWSEAEGRGGVDGEPHMGSHAWPVQNHALISFVEDSLCPVILEELAGMDASAPDLGLRAFSWTVDTPEKI